MTLSQLIKEAEEDIDYRLVVWNKPNKIAKSIKVEDIKQLVATQITKAVKEALDEQNNYIWHQVCGLGKDIKEVLESLKDKFLNN
jgi:Ni,Fe-hydrogenase maturation factor